MLSVSFPLVSKFYTIHDNESEGDGNPDAGGDADGDPGGTGEQDTNKETFTKKELEQIVAQERKRQEDKTKKTITELEQLRKSKNLSDQEKQTLAQRVEELQDSLLTKEELTKKERERLSKQHKETVESLTSERDQWQTKYHDSVILRTITDAAVTEEAFNPQQLIALLRPNTRLVDDLDSDGKPTGHYLPKVKFQEEGVVLDLTVPEAVKRMKETPELFGNLFKANVSGGLGLSGGPGGTAPADIKKMTPEEYRARGRKQLGLKK